MAIFTNAKIEKPLMFISKQDSSLNFNNNLYVYFNLGLKRFISSSIWISTILESDIEHYKTKDLNSWMYLRFNSIAQLEPKFLENYRFGGVYLSIIKDDIVGASELYRQGLAVYPNDYSLLKNASFHFYFEAKNLEAAYPLFKRLQMVDSKNTFTKTTLSRIEANKGNLEQAFELLSEYQSRYPKETMIGKKIFEFRYSIKAEMDLNCLNQHRTDCSKLDLEDSPYALENGAFKAARPWEPYRPRWRR